MATRSGAAARGGQSKSRSTSQKGSADAISLLKADHREVEGWFEEFEKARTDARKEDKHRRIGAPHILMWGLGRIAAVHP